LPGGDATLPNVTALATPPDSPVPIPSPGAQGGAVSVENGIPCVELRLRSEAAPAGRDREAPA
jgi:hypothetical protein